MSSTNSTGWENFEEGATVGLTGTEGGSVMRDEGHIGGARITLERDCLNAPYAITVTIYGWAYHTRFFADEPTAIHEYDQMKGALSAIVALLPGDDSAELDPDALTEAINDFTTRYP